MKLAAHASLSFWNALPAAQRARTLALGRFTSFPLEKQNDRYTVNRGDTGYRRETCDAVAGGAVLRDGTSAWLQFLREGLRLPDDQLLFGQLQSRLMVNMAGGVLENGGLCLDPRTGLPYIPGSAVKGCARRAALAALREWGEIGMKPGEEKHGDNNLFKEACKPFASPAAMLAAIARVFGWCEQDWKTREEVLKTVSARHNEDDAQFQRRCQKLWEEKRSDFAWACEASPSDTAATPAPTGRQIPAQGNALGSGRHLETSPERAKQTASQTGWTALCETVVRQLARELGVTISDEETAPWKRLPNFAGSVSFLPAYPIKVGANALPLAEPDLGALELDVVTCHHGKYYASDDPNAKAEDTEEPVPVVFPAMAAGHVFVFAMVPLRDWTAELLNQARTWLSGGLATFGLGAKTAAGYGWFENVTDLIRQAQDAAKAQQAEQERQRREQSERDAVRANLQPDPALIEKLRGMKEPDLRGQINPFATEERFWTQKDERVQLTVLHFLCITAPDLFAVDRANPKSKIAKATANLAAKFPHVASLKP